MKLAQVLKTRRKAQGLSQHALAKKAHTTAAAVGLAFVFAGDAVLHFLGVTVGDFQIAGGLLLLVLSIHDLLRPNTPLRQPGAPPGWSRSVSR